MANRTVDEEPRIVFVVASKWISDGRRVKACVAGAPWHSSMRLQDYPGPFLAPDELPQIAFGKSYEPLPVAVHCPTAVGSGRQWEVVIRDERDFVRYITRRQNNGERI